ncbi:hypothetical protein DC3_20290 [Deinococcus cellulosilyticus NBRC 106333 = KACC 11606]|uniref:Uncharacterized protein n=2 Tax=Deinococcus cellulosilyticus TaxID=401558 RepID=A0A511N0M5_DEIC1|nr:hypothetical protein DC3_20290 [Deinococcus cellulosilyticus NBRC 106333 = KACC 11606]
MHDFEQCQKELDRCLWMLGHSTAQEGHAHAIQGLRRAYWHIRPYTRQPDDDQPFGQLGSKRMTHRNWATGRWKALELVQLALTDLHTIDNTRPGCCNELAHLIYRAYETL